jgi:hypothetical protein
MKEKVPTLPKLYSQRARLRKKWAQFWEHVDAGRQQEANQVRASLPRPVGDRVFWDLILGEQD